MSQSVSMRSGTHTCLIGEQASLSTLANSSFQSCTPAAADNCLWIKGIIENHTKSFNKMLHIHEKHRQGTSNIDKRHQRYQLLSNSCNTLYATQENKTGQCCNHKTYAPSRNTKSQGAGFTNGIGLYHTTHKAQSQGNSYRKEYSQHAAQGTRESLVNIVNRAAMIGSIRLLNPCNLSQYSLGVNGSHTKESNNPHPENSTRTTSQNCTAGTYDITSTNLSSNSSSQSLEGTHLALLGLTVNGKITKYSPQSFTKAANLDKSGTDTVEKTYTHQQKYQNVVRQTGINCLHHWQQIIKHQNNLPPFSIKIIAQK